MTDWISREQMRDIINYYLCSKAPQFRAKALISRQMAKDIIEVLTDTSPHCEIGSAGFRHWARARFILNDQNELCVRTTKLVGNEQNTTLVGKPVGMKEDLYDLLTEAHESCRHRGRDVTYEHVKKRHSLVPKQLCDMVVKACSYCNGRKERLKLKRRHKQASTVDTSSSISSNSTDDILTAVSFKNSTEGLLLSTTATTLSQEEEGVMTDIIELYYNQRTM